MLPVRVGGKVQSQILSLLKGGRLATAQRGLCDAGAAGRACASGRPCSPTPTTRTAVPGAHTQGAPSIPTAEGPGWPVRIQQGHRYPEATRRTPDHRGKGNRKPTCQLTSFQSCLTTHLEGVTESGMWSKIGPKPRGSERGAVGLCILRARSASPSHSEREREKCNIGGKFQ